MSFHYVIMMLYVESIFIVILMTIESIKSALDILKLSLEGVSDAKIISYLSFRRLHLEL